MKRCRYCHKPHAVEELTAQGTCMDCIADMSEALDQRRRDGRHGANDRTAGEYERRMT